LRDGTKLAARIWLPFDAEAHPVPAILEYLPYRKRDGTAPRDAETHPFFAGHGYASVRVDIRGTGESDGVLLDEYLKLEQDDCLEVLEWLEAQRWCTGACGMIGISRGGFNALQVAARGQKRLKAVISSAPPTRYADDVHYMGAACWSTTTGFDHVHLHPMRRIRHWWGALAPDVAGAAGEPALLVDNWLQHQRRDAYWAWPVIENYGDIAAVCAVGGWADSYSNAVPRLLAGAQMPEEGASRPWAHRYPHRVHPAPIGFLTECLRWWGQWLKGKETGIMAEPAYRVWMEDYAPPAAIGTSRRGAGRRARRPSKGTSRPCRSPSAPAASGRRRRMKTALPVRSPLGVGLLGTGAPMAGARTCPRISGGGCPPGLRHGAAGEGWRSWGRPRSSWAFADRPRGPRSASASTMWRRTGAPRVSFGLLT
jgi:predicted acyl esterase